MAWSSPQGQSLQWDGEGRVHQNSEGLRGERRGWGDGGGGGERGRQDSSARGDGGRRPPRPRGSGLGRRVKATKVSSCYFGVPQGDTASSTSVPKQCQSSRLRVRQQQRRQQQQAAAGGDSYRCWALCFGVSRPAQTRGPGSLQSPGDPSAADAQHIKAVEGADGASETINGNTKGRRRIRGG